MLKYTQEEVAAIINISDRTLRNIEYGTTSTDLETILMLWDLYDLPAEDLFLYYSRDEIMDEMKKLYQNIKKQKIKHIFMKPLLLTHYAISCIIIAQRRILPKLIVRQIKTLL
jgi:DNA-binding XRE family transcriptional regulator